MKDAWGADAPISKPGPVDVERPVMIKMGGFAFTTGGMVHDVTAEEVEEIFFPPYHPEGF